MMILKLKQSKLFKNTFLYTLIQLINKGVPFLLLPILTRYLSTDDYGIIATYNTFIALLVIFIGLSMEGAVSVNFFQLEEEKFRKYVSNIFNLMIASTFLVTLVVIFFQELIISKFTIPVIWIYIAIAVALVQTITGINLTLWRSQQCAKPYAVYALSQTFFNIMISLLLIIGLNYQWEGRTAAIASVSIFFGLLSIIFIYKKGYAKFNYSVEYIKDALKFGIPLLPHQMALWMRSGVDILLIATIVGTSQSGIYSVGYTFGAVVGIFATAFNNAYSPYLFEKLKSLSEQSKIKIVKFTYLYFIGIILFAILLNGVFVLILPYYLGEKFQEASQYIIWIALAYSFQGMYLMVVNYIFYAKKTHFLSMITIFTSIFHVVLSYILIQNYGALGAAYASVISFLLTFVLVFRISYKVYAMPWILWRKNDNS